MNFIKVCVYAISKNEEKFVKRWCDSMKEADKIFVLDTGSTDNTVKLLKENNVNVSIKTYDKFRFDIARNDSLDLVDSDTDICVCTDLDEVFVSGWREKLEHIWKDNTTRLRYNYNWQLDKNNNPKVNFYIEKIHKRNGYRWCHPVHEILKYDKEEVFLTTDEITVNHYPDSSKSRSNYLPLLELSVSEDPTDDRNMHYLGREYMYYGEYKKCINTLKKHLKLKTATWKDERCASMRFIARSYKMLKKYDNANIWAIKAINEAPYLRDPYIEKALIDYEQNNWNNVINYCFQALDIKANPKTYINEIFSYDHTTYDLLSLAFYQKKLYNFSLLAINEALKISPTNKRLISNKKIIKDSKSELF